eukprot:scaffold137442_cov14-Tisochrysis_lutea.AAC.1
MLKHAHMHMSIDFGTKQLGLGCMAQLEPLGHLGRGGFGQVTDEGPGKAEGRKPKEFKGVTA